MMFWRKCCYKARSNRSSPIIQHEQSKGNSTKLSHSKRIPDQFQCCLQLGTNQLGVGLSAERLRALNGHAKSTVDDQLGQDTQGARHTEQDGVVVGLGQAVVLQEHTRVGINVGVRVLGLAVLGQDTGRDLVDLADQLEHGVIGQLAQGKLALRDVAGVGLAQDGVTVTRHDAATVQGGPQVVLDGLVAEVVANGLLHLGEPVQHLLVGQTVERTSQTLQTGGEGEHWGAQSTPDQVGGVGTDVATLVVGVDGQVQAHQLNKILVAAEAELVGQVEGVVLVLLDGGDLAILEDVAVDLSGNGGQLGDQVHRVLEGVVPVVLLVDTLGVGLGEGGLVLKSGHGQGELGHGVEGARAAVDELLNELGDIRAGSPLSRQVADLLLGGDLAGQQKPEETLRQRLLASGSLGQELLNLGDLRSFHSQSCIRKKRFRQSPRKKTYGTATEANTLLRVEDGTLPHEGLDTTGTAVSLVKGDLANDLVAIVPAIALATIASCLGPEGGASDILAKLLDLLDLGGQVVGKGVLEGLSKQVSNSIELPEATARYLGLCGGVPARAVQGGGLHGLCDGGPQSGSTNAERGSHFDP